MTEATNNLSPIPLTAQLMTIARYLARKRIKDELRANGLRIQLVEPADITRAANAYLAVRRAELIAEPKIVLCRICK